MSDDRVLIQNKWKRIDQGDVVMYKDPVSKKLYRFTFALTVQDQRDYEKSQSILASEFKKEDKEMRDFRKWNSYDHNVDDLFTSGSTWGKSCVKKLKKGCSKK